MNDERKEHTRLAPMLDAWIDGELDVETARDVEAHVAVCTTCARAARLHRRLRARLADAPPVPPAIDLHARILGGIRAIDPPGRTHRVAAWGGWAIAASLALVWTLHALFAPRPTPVAIPMVEAAVSDFSVRTADVLPHADLAAVQANVPFPVAPLPALSGRLLATWSTSIRGEPAAALAYRVGTRVVVQYVVSERLFFEQPSVREAIARHGRYSTRDRDLNILGWPRPHSGVLLVGDVDPQVLARLRM